MKDSRADALDAAEQALYTNRIADRYRTASERITAGIADASPLADEPSAEDLVDRLIFGDADTCIEKLQRDVDMFRPTHMSFFAGFGGLDRSRPRRRFKKTWCTSDGARHSTAPTHLYHAVAAGCFKKNVVYV